MAEEILIEKRVPRYSSVQDYISVVFQHKWKGLAFFLVVLVVGVVLASISKDLYKSEAKLLVRMGWESVNPDPTIATGERTGSINQPQAVVIGTVLDILKSQSTAEQVVDKFGPDRILDPVVDDGRGTADAKGKGSILDGVGALVRNVGGLDEEGGASGDTLDAAGKRARAIRVLMSNIEAQMLRNTTVISIGFTSVSPQLSKDVVEELTARFLESNRLVYRTPGSYEFVEEQERTIRAAVDDLEREMQKLKRESGIVDWQKRLEFVEANIGLLEQSMATSQAELKASEAKIEDLRKRQDVLPIFTTLESKSRDYSVIDGLRARILTLRGEEQEALSKFTEDSESVREIRRRIAEVEKQLSDEEPRILKTETEGINSIRLAVETALNAEESLKASLKAKLGESGKQLADAKKERESLIDLQFEFSRLELELSKQKSNYDRALMSLNQASLEQDLERKKVSNVEVIQPATFPLQPADSKRMIFLVASFLGGIAGAIVLAFFFASMDHTLKTPEDIERRLQLPSLVAIPRVRTNRITLKAKLG